MKVIIAIVASTQAMYSLFKEELLKAICRLDTYEFYFLYSGSNQVIINNDYTDFYTQLPFETSTELEISKGLYYKTIQFYKWYFDTHKIECNYKKWKQEGLFFVRTNLSTMFDFNKFYEFLQKAPKENLFTGPFIGSTEELISGTCMISSFDIVWYLLLNTDGPNTNLYLEDEAVSRFMRQYKKTWSINVKRLDVIEMSTRTLAIPKTIVYHKCNVNDNDIFCFRFKTFDRQFDIRAMELLQSVSFDIAKFCIMLGLPIVSQQGKYFEPYSKNFFLSQLFDKLY